MTHIELISDYMKQVLCNDDTGHSVDHINRVVALTDKLLIAEPKADKFIVHAAALLHDVYDDKLFESDTDATAAKEKLVSFLQSIPVSHDVIDQILYIIDNMSWSKTIEGHAKPLDINGQIVQDADRLEAMGAIAVTRAITYGAVKHRVLYDPNIPPRIAKTKAEYRNTDSTTINHFYEKLLLIKDQLNTEAAKQIADSRQQFMIDFLKQFKAEWHLEK
ncbi:HD domain-containing protein [Leuconostoc palmae]|uniref:HD domain-containing protein n=1 Tax=Leuconostoc palmae TaxID=501487 RepID=UPI001C7CF230|nr:HD domain-containing protein [Leuconostoc palmae]